MEIKEAILDIEINQVKNFLASFNLSYENDIDKTLYIEENGNIIASISKAKDIIKCLAVLPSYQSENLSGLLVSKIIEKMHEENIFSYLVFTKAIYENTFINLGMRKLVSTTNTVMLEGGIDTIDDTINKMKVKIAAEYGNITQNCKVGSIVMNANPVTLGHQYLIEKSVLENDLTLVFVVEEDNQEFDFSSRYSLVYLTCKKFESVIVLPASKYIVSKATFPTYFLKEDIVDKEVSLIDGLIFKTYFMDKLKIDKRYVGSETKEKMNDYNQTLKSVLKDKYKGKKCGSFGDITALSFYPNKHITTGEGGMVLTDNERLRDRCQSFRNLCHTPARRFVHEELGYNFRMSNIQAAVGVSQLERIEEHLKKK